MDECLPLVSVVCCQVEVSESYRLWCVWVWSRSPVRRGREPESDRRVTGGKNLSPYLNNSLLSPTLLCWTYLESIMLDVLYSLANVSSASASALQRMRTVRLVIWDRQLFLWPGCHLTENTSLSRPVTCIFVGLHLNFLPFLSDFNQTRTSKTVWERQWQIDFCNGNGPCLLWGVFWIFVHFLKELQSSRVLFKYSHLHHITF